MSDQSQNAPLGPLGPRHVRILKISIGIMTVLLVVGLVALFYGMARQVKKMGSSKPSTVEAVAVTASSEPYRQTLALGDGEVKAVLADHGAIIVHAKGSQGEEIITLEALTGREIGRIRVGR